MSWSVPERSAAVAIVLLMLVTLVPMTGAASSVSLEQPGGGIAFTFGGGWASATLAAQTLEAHDMRGTFYVASGLLRQGPYYTAYLSASEVADLSARGHEIGSMTVTQPDLTTLGSAELARQLDDSKATLQAITGREVRSLAYPYGAVNDAVAAAAASRYDSGRIISWSIADFGGSVDAHHLPGFLVRRATSLSEAKWIVDQAVSDGVFVVLSFERIVTSPGTYDWTPSDLDALAAHVEASGAAVATVSQLVTGEAPAPLPPSPPAGKGTIVFTFDDGSTSHIGAAQALAARGFRGTFYIVSDCARSEADQEMCMSSQQVKALSDAGHDIGSHTVRHRDLTRLSSKALTSELANSQTSLQTLTGKPVTTIAYPYGSHNANVRTAAARYYEAGRIYLADPAPSDLPVLLAQSGSDPMVVAGIGISSASSLAKAKAYIDYAVAHNATIVLVFHDIISPPRDEYSWSPASFAALADHVKASGARVATMHDLYG